MANEKRLIDANRLRESVITDYYEHYTQCHDTDQIALMDMVEYCIEEQPTVDAVEVVHGYWEKEHDDLGIDRGWKCSHCNGSVYEMTYESYQYCPHCGAKMDGERKDNDND